MKILFHINSLGHGGAERVVSVLSSEFADLGHEVLVATQWRSDNEYALSDKVTRLDVEDNVDNKSKGRIGRIIDRYLMVRKCIKKVNPDVVISFCNKANFRCSVAMLGMKTPLVVSVRNDPQRDYKPYRFSTMIMERKASGCVFQTPDAKAFFSNKLQNKSRIIINPLSEKYVLDDWRYSADEWNRKDKTIISVGRLCEQKNQIMLLKAFGKIAKQHPESVLKVFGGFQDEEYVKSLETIIKENELEGQVFLNRDIDDISSELKKAYMFVLSSDYEGMPNALLEALSMGLPSISTDCPCGGPRLLMKDTGILVPVKDSDSMADAMDRLLNDVNLADEYSKEAIKIKEKALPSVVAKEWLDFITNIS